MKPYSMMLTGLLGLFASGCLAATDEDPDGEDVDMREEALEGLNALSTNALSTNSISLNAMSVNAMSVNSIDANTLAAIQDPSSDGALARELLRYTVSCALDATQSFSFSWTSTNGTVHNETYVGMMGLATGWATKPLSITAQQVVSACLLSRVNWYGTSVQISLRGSNSDLNRSEAGEQTAYPKLEGAFMGNLFASPPTAFSCHYGPNIGHSRAKLRDCAAGHLNSNGTISECGAIDILGSCESYCAALTTSGKYYPSCTPPGGSSTTQVITVWLGQ